MARHNYLNVRDIRYMLVSFKLLKIKNIEFNEERINTLCNIKSDDVNEKIFFAISIRSLLLRNETEHC